MRMMQNGKPIPVSPAGKEKLPTVVEIGFDFFDLR
jgi:hypothetical protein